jgi:hypothetical protein
VASPCVTKHVVEVFDRGGKTRIAELVGIEEVNWSRIRDDVSAASLTLTGEACRTQNDVLSSLRSNRHEIAIWRGDRRVWEGPITRRVGYRNRFEIFAHDVLHYTRRLTMRQAYDNRGTRAGSTVVRAGTILQNELARRELEDPPVNVLPYLTLHEAVGDARYSGFTLPYQYQVFEHLDRLAAKSGIDFTAIGRAIHIWDTHQPLGQIQAVATQADFLSDLVVTEYGMDHATIAHSTDGEGTVGSSGTADPYFGTVEMLATAYDESEDTTAPTKAELESQAARNRAGRNPPPVVLRVPENSTIDPNGVLNIDILVPGMWIPVRVDVVGFSLQQMQKLASMKVSETPKGEKISVTLAPASIDDSAEEE